MSPPGLLTWGPLRSTLRGMDLEELLPRKSGDALADLGRQDLDPLSVAELDARIAALEAEIARVRQHRERSVNHRASADSLFKR